MIFFYHLYIHNLFTKNIHQQYIFKVLHFTLIERYYCILLRTTDEIKKNNGKHITAHNRTLVERKNDYNTLLITIKVMFISDQEVHVLWPYSILSVDTDST
jgi:hypothetical protein